MEKILFINPPAPKKGQVVIRDLNRSGRLSKEMTIWPQTSLAMLASLFPNDNVRIIDAIAEGYDYERIKCILRKESPRWVIFNVISSTLGSDMRTAREAKRVGAKTIAVGAHTEVLGESTKDAFPCLDFYLSGSTPEKHLYRIIKNEELPYGFEDFPPARQDLLPIAKYRLPIIGDGYTFVAISRGCPFPCIFCRQQVTWKGKVQFRKIEKVIEEIKKFRLKNIMFHADTATLDIDYMRLLCLELQKLPWKVKWCCNSRVDTVDMTTLQMMKLAGCWMIMYGIESGNMDILKCNRKGGKHDLQMSAFAVNSAKMVGIKVWGYFMMGMLGESKDTLDDTLGFALSLNLDLANFAVATPYPGTEFYRVCEKFGLFNIDPTNWEKYDQNYSCIVDLPKVKGKYIQKYIRWSYVRFYCRPRALWRLLKFFKLKDIPIWFKIIINHLK